MTTGKEILDIPMDDNDAGAATVRDYLKALGRAGVVDGEEDEDGYFEVLEEGEADALILAAIEALQ